MSSYHVPPAGHPPQTELLTGRAVFTEAYAVIPKGVIRDIVSSYLPHWDGMRLWVLARPLSGFAETFSHYLVELAEGGGSEQPHPDRAELRPGRQHHVTRPALLTGLPQVLARHRRPHRHRTQQFFQSGWQPQILQRHRAQIADG